VSNPATKKIYAEYRACKDCMLHSISHGKRMSGGGLLSPANTDVMFVTGSMFVEEIVDGTFGKGAGGEVLRVMGEFLEDDLRQYYITGVVKCQTMPSADIGEFGKDLCPKPRPREIAACSKWLSREIAAINPLVIVALGETALTAISVKSPGFTENFGIMTETMIRGVVINYPVAVMPTFSLLDLHRSSDMSEGGVWNRAFEHIRRAIGVAKRLRENE